MRLRLNPKFSNTNGTKAKFAYNDNNRPGILLTDLNDETMFIEMNISEVQELRRSAGSIISPE